jgi:glyoxylase-like metal-dependent hydrolase (beta-lactamase superfamily II)
MSDADVKNNVSEVNAERLKKILDGEEDWFILDVRNDIEYDRWKIEGKKTPETMNIPYYDFFDDEDVQISKVPTDSPILVVCAKGDSSAFVADILNQKGIAAQNLQGGILAWGDYSEIRAIPGYGRKGTTDRLLQINRVAKGCLSYFMISDGEALVIDPSRHIEVYTELARKENARITHVLDTHLHADHISGGAALAKAAGAAYHIQQDDVEEDAPLPFQQLKDGEEFQIGKSKVRVIAHFHPGHTPGSTSFLVDEKFLMTGDTLFVSGVGRPDLGGMVDAWALLLYDSLFRKFSSLSDELTILPSHFSDLNEIDNKGLVLSTLGQLRRENEALKIDDEEEFVNFMRSQISTQPEIYKDIRLVNMMKKEVDEEIASEMELGKNECAAKKH